MDQKKIIVLIALLQPVFMGLVLAFLGASFSVFLLVMFVTILFAWRSIHFISKFLFKLERDHHLKLTGLDRSHKKIESELAAAKEHAEQASIAKSQFLATVSHEIRTPMNGILGTLDLLQESQLTEQQKEFLSVSKNSAVRLLTIIDDILDFSKIEAGKFEIKTEAFDLEKTILSVTELMLAKANEKNIKLEMEIDEKIPKSLFGDAGKIRQILLNLISNAIKFTDIGSVEISAKLVNATELYSDIKISVRDTGTGINKGSQQHLFKSFSQIEKTGKQLGGTGLGLAISKRLVEGMEGEIGLESEEARGSCFWFTLSIRHQDLRAKERWAKTKIVLPLHIDISNKKILLVDDSDTNRLVVREILKKEGCVVEEAINGLEAEEKIKNNNYDVILMDISMPEKDGIQTTKSIRKYNKEVPIIALTSSKLESDRQNALTAGMNDYLSKPFDKKTLLAIITKHIRYEHPILCQTTLKQLGEDIGAEVLSETLSTFMQESIERVKKIKQALKTKDLKTLEQESHALKSSTIHFGAMHLHHLSKEIEMACKAGDSAQAIHLAKGLEAHTKNTLTSIKTYLK